MLNLHRRALTGQLCSNHATVTRTATSFGRTGHVVVGRRQRSGRFERPSPYNANTRTTRTTVE
jgi:hypothetical protein